MNDTANEKAPESSVQVSRGATPGDLRIFMIKQGLEMEMIGMRLTAKAPPCFRIIATEFGIKVKRGSGDAGKRAAYEAFCTRFGYEAKPPRAKIR
jgi:hypothetical protein